MGEDANGKQQIQIHLQGDLSSLSTKRRTAAIEALASMMKVSPGEVEVYRVYEGSVVLELGVPPRAAERLRSHLQTNNSQLRLLGIKRVILERKTGKVEEWVASEGQFNLKITLPIPKKNNKEPAAAPREKSDFFIPGIWRFHLIYLFVTLAMGFSIYPYSQFVSLLLISGVCAFGILLAFSNRPMAAHVLAVAIGLGAPIVVLAQLLPVQTVIVFLILIFGVTMLRRFLF